MRNLMMSGAAIVALFTAAPASAYTVDFSFTNTTGFDPNPDTVEGTLTFASANYIGAASDVTITQIVAPEGLGSDPFNYQPNFNFSRPYDLGSTAVTNSFTVVNGVVTSYDYNSGTFDNYSNGGDCGGPCGGFQMTLAVNDTTLSQYDSSYYDITTSMTAFAPASATPLPAALPLFAGGVGALGLFGWRRKKKPALRTA